MAAELGHLQLAHDYFAEAALMDLDDLQHNTRDGLHIASLAGTWIVAVCGLGGMRDHNDHLTFNPHLPARLSRLSFRLLFRGRRLKVDVTDTHAIYTLLDGAPLEIRHHGQPRHHLARRTSDSRERAPPCPGGHPSTAASRQARPGLQGPRNQPGRIGALEKAATQPPGTSP